MTILIVIFSSCKKSSNNVNSITTDAIATSQGKFNNSAKATHLTLLPSGYSIKIEGFKGTPNSSDKVELYVNSANPITAGTYSENDPSTPFAQVEIVFSQYVPFIGYVDYGSFQSATDPCIVTISEISATTVKGTFGGTIRNSSPNNPPLPAYSPFSITGNFNANF